MNRKNAASAANFAQTPHIGGINSKIADFPPKSKFDESKSQKVLKMSN